MADADEDEQPAGRKAAKIAGERFLALCADSEALARVWPEPKADADGQ